MINKKALVTLLTTLTITLNGCSLFIPYTPPVQQGKIITANDIKQLKPGMSPSQVQFILGSPDIVDPFHKDTWYYVYTIKYYNTTMEEKKLYVNFKDGKLTSLSGDYPPPEVVEYTKADDKETQNHLEKAKTGDSSDNATNPTAQSNSEK